MPKKSPASRSSFARYKDIFDQWFAVTPQLSVREPPGTLDLESLQKKVLFDPANDIDLSKGGVYDPGAVDDLITWLEGNRRQEVVVYQLADQVGNLNPGQYITPKLMFPSYTLPGGSWHSFILGKIWGAIRRLGEIFSTIFGLFIVGHLVWYLVKVLMNCGYIHRAHGCSPQLAWSFCTGSAVYTPLPERFSDDAKLRLAEPIQTLRNVLLRESGRWLTMLGMCSAMVVLMTLDRRIPTRSYGIHRQARPHGRRCLRC